MSSLLRLFPTACLVVLAAPPAAAQDKEPGVYWEQTYEMQVQGFSMPAQTMKVCLPKRDWTEPPKAQKDGDCRTTNVKRTGNKMTWHMACDGKDKMTGDGEMSWATDSFAGKMIMHTEQGDMTTHMKGRKVGGDCDALAQKRETEEKKKQVEQLQAQQQQTMAQACDGAVEQMSTQMLQMFSCKDRLQDLCARLPTREGYLALMKNSPQGQQDAAQKCRTSLDSVRAKLCASAAKGLKASTALQDSSFQFVNNHCPAEGRAIAQRDCAGVSFCDMEPAQRDFCVKYAQDVLDETEAKNRAAKKKANVAPAAAPSPADEATKAAKGLFGF